MTCGDVMLWCCDAGNTPFLEKMERDVPAPFLCHPFWSQTMGLKTLVTATLCPLSPDPPCAVSTQWAPHAHGLLRLCVGMVGAEMCLSCTAVLLLLQGSRRARSPLPGLHCWPGVSCRDTCNQGTSPLEPDPQH